MQLSLGNDSLGCQADYTYYPAEDSIIPYTEPLTYQFVNLSLGNPDYWFWDFGDGSSTSEVNPVHTFPEPGVYNVCLTIGSNDSSCYSTYCQEVVLQDDSVSCVAQFVHFPSDTVPSELNIQFMDLSYGNATSWSWDFGDGAYASEQNPMHTYAAEGNYYVCLTISSPACQSVWCEEITVGSEIDCFNYFTWQTVDNTAVFSGIHSSDMEAFYFWEFGDGISGTGQTVTHTYSGPGIYYVSLLSYDDGNTCSAQSSQMVVIGDTIAYNQVYGQVFAGDFPLEDGFVMIFSLDTNDNYAPFFDVAMLDPSGVYVFPYVPNGEFLLYAVDFNFSNYLPTYYGDVINWEDATMISLGQANNPYNINMVNATSTPLGGNGTISGQITNSAVKSAGFLDKINMLLFDENKVAIGYTSVSADGEFNLDNLEMGLYYLYPELSGVSAQFIKVELSAEQPDVQVYMTFSGGSITGIDNPEQIIEIGEIFPNPVGDQLNININSKQLQEVMLSITGIDGQVYATSRVHLNSGNDQIRMNVDDLPRGMFILHIAGNHQVNLNKKFIR
jgi:PKD repeat protein